MLPEPIGGLTPVRPSTLSPVLRRQFRLLGICTAGLVVCFALPLFALARFTLRNDLYSHILLIPFVSVYLAWLRKADLISPSPRGEGGFLNFDFRFLIMLAAGLATVVGYLVAVQAGVRLAPIDALAWTTFSFFLLFIAACLLCLDRQTVRTLAFPIGFLIFLVPFPLLAGDAIESFLQHRSADAAELLFGLVGTPLVRKDVAFQLPGFNLQVAPECSGIRSTLVLFITSLVAGQLFLRSPWKRALFALVVIPLGIARNALRIVTIGELCVHVDPGMIDSPIHHRGGPVFFVVSMVPFLLLLWYLRSGEKQKLEKQKAEMAEKQKAEIGKAESRETE